MITEIADVPEGVVGLRLEGRITDQDYRNVLIPACEKALEAGGKVRALVVVAPSFAGYEAAALWDDTAFGIRHFFDFDKIAVVTDNDTLGTAVRGVGLLMPAQIRIFKSGEEAAARKWLKDR